MQFVVVGLDCHARFVAVCLVCPALFLCMLIFMRGYLLDCASCRDVRSATGLVSLGVSSSCLVSLAEWEVMPSLPIAESIGDVTDASPLCRWRGR
ncbi:hypothetical protein Nepgr_033711 [Nepenthes gracilis]|uniref:Uncharacterized protein n=1 Tax=Nepenthes gracilis TaxID=150966 RepID=A0AAD3TLX8_NEPGR|nr:hypothetical protein Nepgr_033711 [Nepenthes gracilis]